MLGSCWAIVAAGLWLVLAEGFWMLLVGQLVLVVSRAAFWPATWAMASELPGNRGIQLGRLNAITNVGQIAGIGACGFLLAAAGFDATFATLAATGLLAFIAGLATRAGPAKALPRRRDLLARYRPLLRQPIILYCDDLRLPLGAAVLAVDVLLSRCCWPSSATARRPRGSCIALRAIGAIAAGLVAARFVRTGPDTPWPVICGVAVAAAVGLLPAVNHVLPIALWMLVIGARLRRHDPLLPDHDRRGEPAGGARLGAGAGRPGLERLAPQHAARHGLCSPTATASSTRSTCSAPARSPARWRSRDAPLGLRRGRAAARAYATLNMPGSSEWRSSRR